MPMKRERYPSGWNDRARAAKEHAGWRCERCGTTHFEDGTRATVLTVHHPNRDPENPEARLQVLCARCHLQLEHAARLEEHGQLPLLFADG